MYHVWIHIQNIHFQPRAVLYIFIVKFTIDKGPVLFHCKFYLFIFQIYFLTCVCYRC